MASGGSLLGDLRQEVTEVSCLPQESEVVVSVQFYSVLILQ